METVEVDKGSLFAVIRAAQGYVEYLKSPEGYDGNEEAIQEGLRLAHFIEVSIDNLVPEL